MKIGIIIAMEKEFVQVAALLKNAKQHSTKAFKYMSGTAGKHEIVIQQCGIGKVNAAVGAMEMIMTYKPDLIISTGCAGASSVDINVKDVVVASRVVFHDVYCGPNNKYGQMQGMPECFNAPEKLVECALKASDIVKSGTIASGDWFVDSVEKTREILSHFPEAIAVDMESGAIAQTCWLMNVPFISFRVISDNALKENNTNTYMNFWNELADESFNITHKFIESIPESF